MSMEEKREQFLLWKLIEEMPVSSNKVMEWARSYGHDFRRAWNECSHAELMLTMALSFDVSYTMVMLVLIECIRSSIHSSFSSKLPEEVESSLSMVEMVGLCGGEVQPIQMLMKGLHEEMMKKRSKGNLETPDHRIVEAVMALNSSMLYLSIGNPDGVTSRVAMSVQAAAHARAALVRMEGMPDRYCGEVYYRTMREFCHRTRRLIPYDLLVSSCIGMAIEYGAMVAGEESPEIGIC